MAAMSCEVADMPSHSLSIVEGDTMEDCSLEGWTVTNQQRRGVRRAHDSGSSSDTETAKKVKTAGEPAIFVNRNLDQNSTTKPDKRKQWVYLKGKYSNIITTLRNNPIKFDKDFDSQFGKLHEPIKIIGFDTLRATCANPDQKALLLKATTLRNTEIVVTEPRSLSHTQSVVTEPRGMRDKQPTAMENDVAAQNNNHIKARKPPLYKGIIFGVSPDVSEDELLEATHAKMVKRFTKRTDVTVNPTTTVLLEYESNLPDVVYLGSVRFKVNKYVPNPMRCTKCQKYGHRHEVCRGEAKCPRCAGAHDFTECNKSREHAKCVNCGGGHSSAFRECPKYIEVQMALKIRAKEEIPYAEALKKANKLAANIGNNGEASQPTAAIVQPTGPDGPTATQTQTAATGTATAGPVPLPATIELLNVVTATMYYILQNLPETPKRNQYMGALLAMTQNPAGKGLSTLRQLADSMLAAEGKKTVADTVAASNTTVTKVKASKKIAHKSLNKPNKTNKKSC